MTKAEYIIDILEIPASGDIWAGDEEEEATWPQLHVCHSELSSQGYCHVSRVPRHANMCVALSQ